MARVIERVGILYVTVTPADAAVVLDGRPLGRADGRGVPVEPGIHTIAARLPGHEDAVKTVQVTAPSSPHIHLELKPRPDVQPPVSAPAGVVSATVPAAPSSPGVVASPAAPVAPRPESSRAPWYQPTRSPRGALVVLTYAGIGVAVASAATSIGLEVDRHALRSSLAPGACAPSVPSPSATCAALAERFAQRDAALAVAIGAHVATGLLAGAARLAFGFERGATSPKVGATVSANGGGIVVLGTW